MGKHVSFMQWLHLALTTPFEAFEIAATLILGEVGRWCLGGGKLREKIGDLITCLLIFYLVRPWIPILPAIAGVKIRPGAIAIVIALLGGHSVGNLLAYYFRKRTGIDIKDLESKNKTEQNTQNNS
ncbi:hypothetical protein CJP72_21460 [Citrobacter sp. NCU1]|nr:hypothetical protein [Citrobacter sp. NCU1]